MYKNMYKSTYKRKKNRKFVWIILSILFLIIIFILVKMYNEIDISTYDGNNKQDSMNQNAVRLTRCGI